MRLFIDTTTGAWGGADDIVIVEATEEEVEDLIESSDSDIIGFAHSKGGTKV